MSAPLSQVEIEARIERLDQHSEVVMREVDRWSLAAGDAEADWKVAAAKWLLKSQQSSDKKREAEAIVEHEELYRAYKHTAALLNSASEAGRMVRSRLEAARSVNANHRPLVSP